MPIQREIVYTPDELAREIGNPTTITLHLHQVPVRQVFDAVTAQAGPEFRIDGANNGKVTVDCDRQPFWTALPSILKETGLLISRNYGNAKYWLQPATPGAIPAFPPGPQVAAGPFVVQLSDPTSQASRQLAWETASAPGGAAKSLLPHLDGQVMCDPKFEMFSIEPIVEKAIDDTGKDLKSDQPVTEPMGAEGVPQASRFSLPLKDPAPGAKMLKTLTGSFHMQVIAQNETWEIPDPLKTGFAKKSFGLPQSRLGLVLTAKRKEADNTIDVAITVNSKSQVPWLITQLLHKNTHWFDANANPIDGLITAVSAGGPMDSFTVRINYYLEHGAAPLAEPVSLAIEVPTDIRTVVVPFAFVDVPLPAAPQPHLQFASAPPGIGAVPERVYTADEIAHDLGNASVLTLHLHDVAPQDVFDAITAQSGVRFNLLGQQSDAKVEVDCDAQPFWAALPAILKQVGYAVPNDFYSSPMPVQPAASGNGFAEFLSGPKLTVGPFVVELTNCTLVDSRTAPWEQPIADDHAQTKHMQNDFPLRVEGRVLCDPKLQMFSSETIVDSAIDDTGKVLNERTITRGEALGQVARLWAMLKEPAPGAKSMKSFGGKMRLQIVAKTEKWEIPDPLKVGAVTKSFGPPDSQLTLTLKIEKKNNDNGTPLDATLVITGNNPAVWQIGESLLASVRWFDAAGKPIEYNFGGSSGGGGPTTVTLTTNYRLAHPEEPIAEPITLALAVPTEIRTVEIPFAFTDLPLP